MEALVDDAEAMAIGMFVSIAISLILCMSSVALINWSALRQVRIGHKTLCSISTVPTYTRRFSLKLLYNN